MSVTAVAPEPMTTMRLPRDLEVDGPLLGVDHPAVEVLHALEIGLVAAVVAVVAGAVEVEVAGDDHGLAGVAALGGDGPAGVVGRPLGRHDPMVEPDLLVDPGLGRGVADVGEDLVAVGDGLLALPGAERVAEGEHVRVGPDARVAEQVPGAADGVAGLEDGEGRPRAVGLEPVGGADARQPGADDEDVEVLDLGDRLGDGHAAAPASLSLSSPSVPKRRACHSSTSSSVSWSSGWKSLRS